MYVQKLNRKGELIKIRITNSSCVKTKIIKDSEVKMKIINDIEGHKFYTIQDLVELIHMEEGTIRNRLSSGKSMPPSIKIGRRRLFSVREFEEWLSNIDRIS